MSPPAGILRKAGEIVPELDKYILFFGAIIFLLLSGRLLMFALESRTLFHVIESNIDDSYYLATLTLTIYLIVLSILSLLSLFYQNERIIRWFTLASCFNIVLIDATLLYVSPRLTDITYQVREKLQALKASYAWLTSQQAGWLARDATQKWDNLQTGYQCCRLYSPEDWTSFRPETLAANVYPSSCCPSAAYNQDWLCSDVSGIYLSSCMDKISAIDKRFIRLIGGLVWSNIILAALGSIVMYSRRKQKEPEQNYKSSRNTAAFLFVVIGVCSVIQCIIVSQRS